MKLIVFLLSFILLVFSGGLFAQTLTMTSPVVGEEIPDWHPLIIMAKLSDVPEGYTVTELMVESADYENGEVVINGVVMYCGSNTLVGGAMTLITPSREELCEPSNGRVVPIVAKFDLPGSLCIHSDRRLITQVHVNFVDSHGNFAKARSEEVFNWVTTKID